MVDLTEQLYALPGGDKFKLCIQCGTCAASCPSVSVMRYSPRQVIALVRAGMVREVLRSNAVWVCASCYMCTVRCPCDIQPTELMHALQTLGSQNGLLPDGVAVAAFYRTFAASVKARGRVHELGVMFRFLVTRPRKALQMLPVGISLFRRGRLRLWPPRAEGVKELSAMLKALREEAPAAIPAQAGVVGGGVRA